MRFIIVCLVLKKHPENPKRRDHFSTTFFNDTQKNGREWERPQEQYSYVSGVLLYNRKPFGLLTEQCNLVHKQRTSFQNVENRSADSVKKATNKQTKTGGYKAVHKC